MVRTPDLAVPLAFTIEAAPNGAAAAAGADSGAVRAAIGPRAAAGPAHFQDGVLSVRLPGDLASADSTGPDGPGSDRHLEWYLVPRPGGLMGTMTTRPSPASGLDG
ncbi:hypothetical protein tb265_24950 [Gemmatimonadetes bacterium T265]|nr:hypothetical protein tb265_24950 [Gemmatimonadetes bacterium T265]